MYTCTHHGWESDERQCPLCLYPHIQPIPAVEDAKKEFAPDVGRNTQQKKIFESVCWRKYGQSFDTLCNNYRQQSGGWFDLILLAMSEWAAVQCDAKDKEIEELKEYIDNLKNNITAFSI